MPSETGTRKATTLADLMAAAKLGAIDPQTEVIPTSAIADALSAERQAGVQAAYDGRETTRDAMAQTLPAGTDHECAIPGCRHGAAHGPTQPDRQVKLACPNCGAVARMTAGALARAGSITCGDGGTFVPAERRTYNRKVATA